MLVSAIYYSKKISTFYNIFLNSDDSYYDIFISIQSDIRRLDKPIIVVLDDVDRVDRISDIKRLFYIIEKLSNCSNGKIKFIVQYNSLELEKKRARFTIFTKVYS